MLKIYVCTFYVYLLLQSNGQYVFKGIYLSKALTCMNFFLYKNLLFYQGDGYPWPHCCLNNWYISHWSLYVPAYSFWAIHSMLISLFRVTSWFDTVCNIVTHWVNFRKNSCINMNYNYPTTIFRSIFAQNVQISVENIYLQFLLMNFSRSKWKKNVNNTRNTYIWVENTSTSAHYIDQRPLHIVCNIDKMI